MNEVMHHVLVLLFIFYFLFLKTNNFLIQYSKLSSLMRYQISSDRLKDKSVLNNYGEK